MIQKTITITEEHEKWLQENHIKLSSLVREAINQEMEDK